VHQDLSLALINEMLSEPTSPDNKILIKVLGGAGGHASPVADGCG
jgi:hypothetical protein